jgi:hypothetical protein
MNADAILERLAELARLIESHKAAAFVLDLERLELQAKLRASGWIPPELLPEGNKP